MKRYDLPIWLRTLRTRTRKQRWQKQFTRSFAARTKLIAHVEMVARIAAGAALGGVIGYERHVHGRPVGLRTHLIVAMTAATFMVISSQFVYFQRYGRDDLVSVDSSRIAASVVAAIGFLAAGAILRTGITVQGLTTAAGLWLVTAIGMSAGAGMYLVAVVVTVMGVLALTVMRRFEDKKDNVVRRRISVVVGDATQVAEITSALRELGTVVSDIEYEKRMEEGKKRTTATFDVQIPRAVDVGAVIARLERISGIRRVRVQHHGG